MLGVLYAMVGTLIAGAIGALAWRWWREVQEVRLLRAFLKLSDRDLNSPVALYKAEAEAKLQDVPPVVERLLRKRQIGPWPKRNMADIPPEEWETEKHKLTDKDQFDPDYFFLNHEGRARAEENRWWWVFGR